MVQSGKDHRGGKAILNKGSDMKWRVNVLAIVAAVVGIVSIFSVWLRALIIMDFNLVYILNNTDTGLLLAAGWLFIIGALLCFLSPTGCVPEIVGVVLYLAWFIPETEGNMPSGIGPYIGIASAVIAIIAMGKPFGLGYGAEPPGVKGRLLTFSKKPSQVVGKCVHCGGVLRESDRFCRSCGKTVAPETDSTQKGEHCRTCGNVVKPEDQFCESCGRRL